MSVSAPDWFHDQAHLPPFADASEWNHEYEQYLAGIPEEQFHGIRIGDDPGEVLILHEKPGASSTVASSPFMDWIDPHDALRLASFMLEVAYAVGVALDASPGDVAPIFAERIVTKLSYQEWTLTFSFIRTWVNLIRSNL